MISPTAARQWVLVLTLLLGQWLAAVHPSEHPGLAPDVECATCVHGHHLDPGLTAWAAPSFHVAGHERAAPVRLPLRAQRLVLRKPIRGPPPPTL